MQHIKQVSLVLLLSASFSNIYASNLNEQIIGSWLEKSDEIEIAGYGTASSKTNYIFRRDGIFEIDAKDILNGEIKYRNGFKGNWEIEGNILKMRGKRLAKDPKEKVFTNNFSSDYAINFSNTNKLLITFTNEGRFKGAKREWARLHGAHTNSSYYSKLERQKEINRIKAERQKEEAEERRRQSAQNRASSSSSTMDGVVSFMGHFSNALQDQAKIRNNAHQQKMKRIQERHERTNRYKSTPQPQYKYNERTPTVASSASKPRKVPVVSSNSQSSSQKEYYYWVHCNYASYQEENDKTNIVINYATKLYTLNRRLSRSEADQAHKNAVVEVARKYGHKPRTLECIFFNNPGRNKNDASREYKSHLNSYAPLEQTRFFDIAL